MFVSSRLDVIYHHRKLEILRPPSDISTFYPCNTILTIFSPWRSNRTGDKIDSSLALHFSSFEIWEIIFLHLFGLYYYYYFHIDFCSLVQYVREHPFYAILHYRKLCGNLWNSELLACYNLDIIFLLFVLSWSIPPWIQFFLQKYAVSLALLDVCILCEEHYPICIW